MRNLILLMLLLLLTGCSTSHKTIAIKPMIIEKPFIEKTVQNKVKIDKYSTPRLKKPQTYSKKNIETPKQKKYKTNQISKIDRTKYDSISNELLQNKKLKQQLDYMSQVSKQKNMGREPFFAISPKKKYNFENHKKFQYFICQNLPREEQTKCINKFNRARATVIRSDLQRFFLLENYSMFVRLYANIPMNYWTANRFKEAKLYLDDIDLFLDTNQLHKYKSPETVVYSYRTRKAIQGTFESDKWFFTHRYIRFIENTLRTRHKYLCKSNECLEKAWKVTQKSISSNFVENIITSYIESLDNTDELEQLFIKKDLLKAQRAILIMAEKENIFSNTKRWQNVLYQKIRKIESMLLAKVNFIKSFDDVLTLNETKNSLNRDETIISYLYSMDCREPLIWQISKNRTTFTKAKKEGCSSGKLREKITLLKGSLENDKNINDLKNNKDLIFLRKVLLDSLKLPKEGSILYFIVDETMSSIPFELLPMKSGKLLGEMYQISYIPSVSVLNTLKYKDINKYDKKYIGFAKNEHSAYQSLGNLRVNETLKHIENSYQNSVIFKESTETEIYKQLSKKINVKYVQFLTHNINKSRNNSILLYGKDIQNNGELTDVEFIQHTKTSSDTLLLTSCDSIGGKYDYLGESFSPLSQSMFSALKAKRMIATRWRIKDNEVKDFTMAYLKYREKDGLSSIKAFYKALERLKKIYYNEPRVWASFMHIGI